MDKPFKNRIEVISASRVLDPHLWKRKIDSYQLFREDCHSIEIDNF